MIKEKPILFNTEMVKAILVGNKIMTRRVIKVQPPDDSYKFCTLVDTTCIKRRKHIGNHYWCQDAPNHEFLNAFFPNPYGIEGDLLWVRETYGVAWNTGAFVDPSVNYKATLERIPIIKDSTMEKWKAFYLKPRKKKWGKVTWKPSIFMPKWASRIWLKVISVRVERLQDISEEDAEKEGIDFLRYYPDVDETLTAKELFMCLWDSINGKPRKDGQDISWESNPWVWVVEFESVDRPQAAKEEN